MEKITAIIKTKNADKTLCNILESIKTIDEIIALDDNSTDDTIDILKEYKAKIVYFSYNELDYALNQALADAMGDWILIVEQDEIIPSSLIEKLKNYNNDSYYSKMAVSWCLAELIIKNYKQSINIDYSKLHPFVVNKGLTKALESYRLNEAQKEKLRQLRNLHKQKNKI